MTKTTTEADKLILLQRAPRNYLPNEGPVDSTWQGYFQLVTDNIKKKLRVAGTTTTPPTQRNPSCCWWPARVFVFRGNPDMEQDMAMRLLMLLFVASQPTTDRSISSGGRKEHILCVNGVARCLYINIPTSGRQQTQSRNWQNVYLPPLPVPPGHACPPWLPIPVKWGDCL